MRLNVAVSPVREVGLVHVVRKWDSISPIHTPGQGSDGMLAPGNPSAKASWAAVAVQAHVQIGKLMFLGVLMSVSEEVLTLTGSFVVPYIPVLGSSGLFKNQTVLKSSPHPAEKKSSPTGFPRKLYGRCQDSARR
jgi:hypothetical protein